MADMESALTGATAAKWQSLIIVIVSTIVKLCAIFQTLGFRAKKRARAETRARSSDQQILLDP